MTDEGSSANFRLGVLEAAPLCRAVLPLRKTGTAGYVELHACSAFSFLEGASLPEELIRRCAELDQPAIALADAQGVYGSPRFHKTWITRIVVNCCLMQLRERRARPQVALDDLQPALESHTATPETLCYLRELQAAQKSRVKTGPVSTLTPRSIRRDRAPGAN